MIKYTSGGFYFLLKIFQLSGSVFPKALIVALPCAATTAALTVCIRKRYIDFLQDESSVLKDNAAWGGFSFLVGFLIVFRTSQSYNRFWDGCTSTHHMRAEWFDGCSSLVAFCRHSKADKETIADFQNTLVRLFSMLHAAALGEIEDSCSTDVNHVEAFKFELIDVEGIDEESLKAVRDSHAKVELIFQWIQQLIVEQINTGVLSIPPPILSRSFQEIANGMVAFHDAMKISYIPFPFPYAQTCDFLLLLHWLVGPFVVSQWVSAPFWGFIFSFTQIFILWALNFIAVELENPFGMDANDIDGREMQLEMNEHLLLLMRPSTRRTPRLSSKMQDLSAPDTHLLKNDRTLKSKCFCDVWNTPNSTEPVARRFSVAANPRRNSLAQNERRKWIRFSQLSASPARSSMQSEGGGVVREENTFERTASADTYDRRQMSPRPDGSGNGSSDKASACGEPLTSSMIVLGEEDRSLPKNVQPRSNTEDFDEEPQTLPLPRIVVLDPIGSKDPWTPTATEGSWRGSPRGQDWRFETGGWQEEGIPAPWPSQGAQSSPRSQQAGPRVGTKQRPLGASVDDHGVMEDNESYDDAHTHSKEMLKAI